ncbi:MAG: 1,2-phenylacetyl-CoA epoxidase subunit PaaD [Anaerolineales bacterium]|jgi:ring-1,2-phenylacetyl-CoA epoxidase subunit PaaD
MDQNQQTNISTASEPERQVWEHLSQIKDPEIPVVSIVEMGIVRQVVVKDGRVAIRMTPTFSGCPALETMRSEITTKLYQAGYAHVEIEITHNPPWTSDWITPQARRKLKTFGLAPPPVHQGDFALLLMEVVKCPYCGSENTSVKNTFGSTLCRAIYYCNNCQQPFEQFKPL